jgi:hypothetical protein
MSLLNFLNKKEHDCTSTPTLTIILPESLEQESIEIEKSGAELKLLLESIVSKKSVFEAKKTLFWSQIHAQWPEVKKYQKNRVSDDNRKVLAFDCENCPNKQQGTDLSDLLGGLLGGN